MPKRLLKDMVPVKHTIKEIRRESSSQAEPREKEETEKRKQVKIATPRAGYTKNRSRYFLWIIAFISLAFCFFAVSYLFSKAEIVVNPKITNVVLNEQLSASKDLSNGNLSFDLVVISGDTDKTLQSSAEKNVKESATGTVTIYNAFSSSPQVLSVDTRLEGSNGKIYKTKTRTTVPGIDKNGVPGQATVDIYATEAGPDYNSAPLDFQIIGFQGTSKYEKIYARSENAITGGFVGQEPDISDADKMVAFNELQTTLQEKLLQKISIPSGFVLFKNATFLSTSDSDLTSANNTDGTATLTLSGTLYGILFNEQQLTKKIAEDNISKYTGDGSDVFISNIQNLAFSLPAAPDLLNGTTTSFDNVQNINFTLLGPAKIVWKVDVDKFTADLLGKSKTDFNQVLAQYPNIDSATLNVSPVWRMSIPDKSKNINIIVNNPQ